MAVPWHVAAAGMPLLASALVLPSARRRRARRLHSSIGVDVDTAALLSRNVPSAVLVIDGRGTLTELDVSEAAAELADLVPETGRSVFELFRDDPEIIDAIRRCLAGERVEGDVRIGTRQWDVRLEPARDRGGNIRGAFGIALDVTERRAAEREVARNRARDLVLADQLDQAVVAADADGRILFANPMLERLFGPRAVVPGTKVDEVLPRELVDVLQCGAEVPDTVVVRGHDGGPRTLRVRAPRGAFGASESAQLLLLSDETAAVAADAARRRDQLRLRAMHDALPDLLLFVRVDGLVLDLSAPAGWDLDAGDLVGRTIEAVPLPGVDALARAIGDGESHTLEWTAPRDDGHLASFEARIAPVGAEHTLVVVRDVTERHEAEVRLRASEERYRSIVETATEGIGLYDLDDRVIFANDRLAEIFGAAPAEMIGRAMVEFVPPEEHSSSLARRQLRRDGTPLRFEMQIVRADGELVDVLVSSRPLRDADGRVVSTLSMVTDITERKRAEDALAASEARVRAILAALPDALSVSDRDGYIREIAFGTNAPVLDASSYVGRNFRDIFSPEEAARQIAIQHSVLDRGEGETQYQIDYGYGERWIESRGARLDDDHVLWFSRDITERVEAQRALAESEAQYRRIVETAAEGIMLAGPDNRITFANPRLLAMLGRTEEELIGSDIVDLVVPERRPFAREHDTLRRSSGDSTGYEQRLLHRDGREINVFASISPVFGHDGTYEGALVMVTDITERTRAQRALEASERRLRAIYNALPDLITVFDRNGVAVDVGGDLTWFGSAATDVAGRSLDDLYPTEIAAERLAMLQRVLDEGSGIYVLESTLGDRRRVVEVRSVRLDDDHVLAINRDITEAKRAEDELRASQQHLQAIQDAFPDIIMVVDKELRIVEGTVGKHREYHAALASWIGRSPDAVATGYGTERRVQLMREAFERGSVSAEVETDWGAGPVWFELHGVRMGEEHLLLVLYDITARKRAEQGLRASEERYRDIVETATEGIMVLGPDYRFTYVNERAEEMLGYGRGELDGLAIAAVLAPTEQQVQGDRIARRRAGIAERFETRLVRKDGTTVPAFVSSRPRFDDDGEFVGAFSMVTDLSELKRAELEQRRADERLRALVANLNDAVLLLDDEHRIVWANPSRAFARNVDELFGADAFAFAEQSSHAALTAAWHDAAAHPGEHSHEFEISLLPQPGARRWVRGTFTDLRNDPAVGYVLATLRDVTAVHEATEERAELLRRLDAAEEDERRRLAADLHDGPVQSLAALALRLGTLRLGLADDAERAERVREIEARVRESVSELRTLMFDLQPPDLAENGLAAAVRGCAAMIFDTAGADTVVVHDHLAVQPPERVGSVVYRIAREALTNVHRHAHASRVEVELECDGRELVVVVTDDGVGVPESVLEHGAPGHLGLRTMHERAEAAGGTARVERRPLGGTRVEVRLPLADPA